MSRNTWIGVVVAVVVIGGGVFWFTKQPVQAPMVNNSTVTSGDTKAAPATTDTTSPGALGKYLMVDIATHNSAASCWSVIDGNVYDLTNWIPQHPGGQQAIEALCGIDGTAAFHGQHGDRKKQADILATMKIGVLSQ